MKKFASLFTALILLFSSISIIQPINVHAEQTQSKPFSASLSNLATGGSVEIAFTTKEELFVNVFEEGSTVKQSIFKGSVTNGATISGIILNKIYQINIETAQEDFYTGTLTAYDKPESSFVGVLLDVDKLNRGVFNLVDPDDERSVMVQAASEVEKNNNFKTANKIPANSIIGKIDSKNDVDYFQTMFYTEGDAIFVLDNIPVGKDYDLYIFDSNQQQIGASCTTGYTESVTIKNVSLNKVYYVEVVGFNGSFDKVNDYTLYVDHIQKPIDNSGHTFETAKVITTITPVASEIRYSGDSSYFKFTPAEDGAYIIGTTGTTDTYGYLYNQNFVLKAKNDDKPNDLYGNFEIKQELKANKQYFIQISHYSTGTGSFNLVVTKENTSPTTNNNIDNPTVVSVDVDIQASFNTADSQQWFSFTPNETGSYRISSLGTMNTYGVLLDDSKSKVIIENGNVVGTNNFDLSNTLIEGQTYYIKTTPQNFSQTNNNFNLRVVRINNPSDDGFIEQWGMLNFLNGKDINILPAWQYAKGNGFKIGVADSGTYIDHEDLSSNINFGLSYNFIHDMKDVFPLTEPMNPNSAIAGHGTHVAGIIGAVQNNIGVIGVAPESSILPLKVVGRRLPDNPTYLGSIAAFANSISYAQTNGIKVLNCSFGGSAPFAAEQDAMFNAHDILFVIAAGNSSHNLADIPEYPACYGHDNSLVVAALNENGELASFSNYGGPTDIAAPGESIYSTLPSNSYGYNSGTSMAAPFVTGVAGLVWSNNLSLDPVAVKSIITNPNNVTKLSSLNNKVLSGGLLNAFKAVISDNTEVSTRSVMSADEAQRNIFGRDIKASITYYKSQVADDLKTSQIIVKFDDGVDVDVLVSNIQNENSFGQLEKIDYIDLINAYVFETSNIDEAGLVVDAFNALSTVKYAEINYLRDMQ